MATIAQIVSANASKADPYWTPSATRRWPEQAVAAANRGVRSDSKQSKASHTASKAGKRDQVRSKRIALGMPG